MKMTIPLFSLIILIFCSGFSQAQWVQTNGPYGGEILTLAINGNSVFAGTWNGVFLSTDSGSSWTSVNNGLTDLEIELLYVDGNTIYVGTNDDYFVQQIMVHIGRQLD